LKTNLFYAFFVAGKLIIGQFISYKEIYMQKKTYHQFYIVKAIMIIADLLLITLIYTLFVFFWEIAEKPLPISLYHKPYLFLVIFWLVFEKIGLYQGCAIYSGASLGPVEELRRTFYAITAIFLGLGFANYIYRPDNYLYSRGIFLGTYLGCLFIIPANHILLRKILAFFNIWGVSTVIIGSGKSARNIYEKLQNHSEYGLRPIGYFTDHDLAQSQMPAPLRNLGKLEQIESFCRRTHINYAIIAKDAASTEYIHEIMKQYGPHFSHILFIPRGALEPCAWVTPKDISGTLGLEIRHNLQIPHIYRTKRIIDYLLTWPCTIAALPVMGLIALWVKIDSTGPVFFKHRRLSKNGKKINIYKFRTMVQDAGPRLNELFQSNPALKKEWKTYGKLENDPRITRAGKWLRRTSLDELPQLFNVLQGKLTLVGPRPIIDKEKENYGDDIELFNKVLPGVTGLWQVSGRNELTYTERVRLDKYYVNNWSIWLDLYILAKTFFAVFFRHGAK